MFVVFDDGTALSWGWFIPSSLEPSPFCHLVIQSPGRLEITPCSDALSYLVLAHSPSLYSVTPINKSSWNILEGSGKGSQRATLQ